MQTGPVSRLGPAAAHALHIAGAPPPHRRPPAPRWRHTARSLPPGWDDDEDVATALPPSGEEQRLDRPWENRETRRRNKPPAQPISRDIPLARLGPGQTSAFFSSKSWAEVGTHPELVKALADVGISRPSHIQAAAFAALSSAAPHVVLADHAGSGKTLAYLLPLVQALKAEEAALGGRASGPNCPRIVVAVPTEELCGQVIRVCRALSASPTLRFSSAAMTGGRPLRTQRQALEGGVDVAVGTPGRLAQLLDCGALSLDRCAAVVLDEVDVLMGPGSLFAEQVMPLQEAAPPSTRFVLVTATLPAAAYTELELQFPGLVGAFGPGLHRSPPGVTEQIVDCSGGDEVSEESGQRRKMAALFASLQERRTPRAIVFCNKIETCRAVENFLNRILPREDTGPRVLAYHAAIADEQRADNLRRFLAPPRQGGRERREADAAGAAGEGGYPQERLILVATDRASRGVDSAFVDHVVLFDFPRDPSEYVRRVGRTARGAGGRGLVTVLVLGRQVKLAQDVVGRNQKGLPVHAVPDAMPAATGTFSSTAARVAPAAAAAAAADNSG